MLFRSIDLVSNNVMQDLIQNINEIAKTGKESEDLYELTKKFLEYYVLLAEQLKGY